MRRLSLGVSVLALVLSACTSAGTDATDTVGENAGPTETTVAPVAATTLPPGSTEATSGRPAAPDFTLELGNGGTYTLAEGSKPVYLVFWAEW